jgi:hypothetical protein
MNALSLRVLLCAFAAHSIGLSASADPGWWSQPTTGIWSDGPVNVENRAAVNLGQLKHVNTQSARYLDEVLAPLGAGREIDALLAFNQEDNFSPANVGQLKHLSSKFYARLHSLGFDVRPGLIGNGAPSELFDTQTAPWMPWDPAAPAVENAGAINIGQMKLVYSFDVSAWASADTNTNSIPDWLEDYAGSLPAGMDSDGDGLSDEYELMSGSNSEDAPEETSAALPTGLVIYQPAVGLK